MIVPPDEIELEITLTEHGSGSTLKKIETAFMKMLSGNDLSKNDIIFNSAHASFYWYYWWHHRGDARKSKKLTLKLDAKTDFLKLVKDLDKAYVTNIRITKTTNKDIQKLRRKIKVEAIKAAKTKAAYLLEAVDEEVGQLIQVSELKVLDDPSVTGYWNNAKTRRESNTMLSYSKVGRNSYIENVPSIRLRYEIKTTFEIK